MTTAADLADPRPLVGEPLSMDLLNTVWRDAGTEHDLLADRDGLRIWLRSTGMLGRCPDDQATLDALREAREAIRAHVDDRASSAARARLNAVLARGSVARALTPDGPASEVQVEAPQHLVAWTAVEDYLQLLARAPDRIRKCSHPDCVLHFFDTSPRGERRWCSMAGCGNRAKAARHYSRTRGRG